MAAVTICSDFGAQKNKVFHSFPIYLPLSDGTELQWAITSYLLEQLLSKRQKITNVGKDVE